MKRLGRMSRLIGKAARHQVDGTNFLIDQRTNADLRGENFVTKAAKLQDDRESVNTEVR